MAPIDRPDWGSGGDRSLVNTSTPGTTTGGTGNIANAGDATAHAVPAEASDGESSLSESQIERADIIGERLLERFNCPDRLGLDEALSNLTRPELDLIGVVLAEAKATDDPYDILVSLERRATIPQLLRYKEVFQQMDADLQNWFRSFEGEEE